MAPVSFGRRVSLLAARHPDAVAISFVACDRQRDLSWADVDHDTNRLARFLSGAGASARATVVIGLPNCPEHFLVAIAAWKLGALVLPISARLPPAERQAILAVADADLVVAEWDDGDFLHPEELAAAGELSGEPLADVVPHPGKAIASGGSTGSPKVIVSPTPWAFPLAALEQMARAWAGVGLGEMQLVAGPLYHNLPFSWAHLGLFLDHRLIVMDRFDAASAVEMIERHRVTFLPAVPTMMQRILLVPDIAERDLSSLRSLFHTAAPCPTWVKRGWIERIGGERIYELYASTEGAGSCTIRGDEWLHHPGSVGRPSADTELKVLDDTGKELPPGEVGELFMRPKGGGDPTYTYRGSPSARTTADGFVSVGDMGWTDDKGYVFLADRRADLIITGGANVYPAEVELALAEHPAVLDCAVVGVPSADWGSAVHAIIEPVDASRAPDANELYHHCRELLAPYKIPKSYEIVAKLPRDEAGKIRRSALAAERADQGTNP